MEMETKAGQHEVPFSASSSSSLSMTTSKVGSGNSSTVVNSWTTASTAKSNAASTATPTWENMAASTDISAFGNIKLDFSARMAELRRKEQNIQLKLKETELNLDYSVIMEEEEEIIKTEKLKKDLLGLLDMVLLEQTNLENQISEQAEKKRLE
jgi:hypothetical protein